jgi:uncharacterized protein YbjT (DUF2867 family)
MSKTIVVIGATGLQGNSVAKHLLESGKFKVRAIARDPSSAAAQDLAKRGAEVVKADIDLKESLLNAFKDCYGLFGVSPYPASEESEWKQGTNIADAAKEAGLKHVVWSSLEDVDEMTNGRLHCPHFRIKEKIANYMKEIGLPLTVVRVAFYLSNLYTYFPFKEVNGVATFSLIPMQTVPLDVVDVDDLGGVVLPIFNNPQEWIGKSLGIASESLTISQLAEAYTKGTGKPSKVEPITIEQLANSGSPDAREYADIFQFYTEFAGKIRDPKKSRELYPQLKTAEEFFRSLILPANSV